MSVDGYEILPCGADLIPGVAELLRHLVGGDADENARYLTWKYVDNPYAVKPLGTVAFCEGTIVGFRGYFPTVWHVPATGHQTVVLSPGDTCVHPDHRKRGLSVDMGHAAMEMYAPDCKAFLNLSSGVASAPGYMRMGFAPIMSKTRLMRASLLGLVKYACTEKLNLPLRAARLKLPTSAVEASDGPMPDEMAALSTTRNIRERRLTIWQDAAFFRWRFNNPNGKYVFYYGRDGEHVTSYLVAGVSRNNRHAHVLDFAPKDAHIIGAVLGAIVSASHFDLISMYRFMADHDLLSVLSGLKFRVDAPRKQGTKQARSSTVLVRPVTRSPAPDDAVGMRH